MNNLCVARSIGARALVASLLLTTLLTAATAFSSTAGAATPGVTKGNITIGVVTDQTGPEENQGTAFTSAFDAVVASINAKGGVYGRKIGLVTEDDQSTPSGNLAATQGVVQEHNAFAVVQLSGVSQGSSSYLNAQGIPTIALGFTSTPSPYNNLFNTTGGVDANNSHTSTAQGEAFKFLGASKVGGLTFTCAPCAVGVQQGVGSAVAAGLQKGYINTTLAIGVKNWTPYVNQMQSTGTNGDSSILQLQDALGYYSALDEAGIKMVKMSVDLFGNAYLQGASKAPMQGVYVEGWFQPAQLSTPATRAETAILKKYGHQSGLPDWNATNGYVAGELLQTALQAAGPNPTRSELISKLRAVTNWNAAGLAGKPVNFSKALTNPTEPGYGPGNCLWILQARGSKFVPVRKAPFCGPTVNISS